MPEWEGWSTDQGQVDTTKVVAALLASLDTDGQTTKSTGDAVTELELTNVNADELAVRLVELGLFRADSLSMAPAEDTLLISPNGRRTEAEFRQASSRRVTGPPARRALLLWRFDCDVDRPHSSEMLTAPHAWFYGSKFSDELLASAADNLVERGYLEAMKQTMGRVGRRIQLTAAGTKCVENFDGDPEAMDRAISQGQTISIDTYHQQGGSAAFGSTVGSQHTGSADVQIGRPTFDLAAVMQILSSAGDIPEQFLTAIIEAQIELRAAFAAGDDARSAVEQSRQLIATLNDSDTMNPAAQALLTAAVDYVTQRGADASPVATVSQ